MNLRLAVLLVVGLLLVPRPGISQDAPPKVAGVDVPAPKRTKSVPPHYPPEAQALGMRGIVILELVVGPDGKVVSARVTRSVPPFDDAALTAAREWEYEITKVEGKPVSVILTVPIEFKMRLHASRGPRGHSRAAGPLPAGAAAPPRAGPPRAPPGPSPAPAARAAPPPTPPSTPSPTPAVPRPAAPPEELIRNPAGGTPAPA